MTVRFRIYFAIAILMTAFILLGSIKAAAQPEGGAIMAITEKASSGGGRATAGTAESSGKSSSSRTSSALPSKTPAASKSRTAGSAPRPVPAANPNSRFNGPVIGDKYSFLNFEIAEKVQPTWTLKAQSAGALGLVQVEVSIDQNGNVLSAHARTGNPLLHPEAERAALATRFNKPTADGRAARAVGFIVYRFGTEEQEYEQERKSRPKPDQDEEQAQGVHVPLVGGRVLFPCFQDRRSTVGKSCKNAEDDDPFFVPEFPDMQAIAFFHSLVAV